MAPPLVAPFGILTRVYLILVPVVPNKSRVFLQPPTLLRVVPANSALRLKAELDFKDGDVCRVAGDEWLFRGPGKLSRLSPKFSIIMLHLTNPPILVSSKNS